MMVRRFCPLAVDRISRCHFGGSLWSCRNTAVMGSRSDSRRIALRVSYSFPLPKIELTFLEMYRGPGWGSIPSSCTSLIHTVTPVACGTLGSDCRSVLRWWRVPFPFCGGLRSLLLSVPLLRVPSRCACGSATRSAGSARCALARAHVHELRSEWLWGGALRVHRRLDLGRCDGRMMHLCAEGVGVLIF